MAEKTLNDALKIAPDDPLANRTLAAVYLGTGRHALAEKPLKLVVDVTKTARSKFVLAEYYTRERRLKEARLVLEPLRKSVGYVRRSPDTIGSAGVCDRRPRPRQEDAERGAVRVPQPSGGAAGACALVPGGRPASAGARSREGSGGRRAAQRRGAVSAGHAAGS
jgi:hypothetical protein